MQALSEKAEVQEIYKWDTQKLLHWLEMKYNINRKIIEKEFVENGITGSSFLLLTEEDLTEMGIRKIEPKKLLLKIIKETNALLESDES